MKGLVPSLAVVCHVPRRRRVGDQGPRPGRHRRQATRAHVGPDRTPHRPRERVVPARVEDHDARPRLRHRVQHVVQGYRLPPHRRRRRQARIDRHEVVGAVHLHAVPRVERQGEVGAGAHLLERRQRVLHRVLVGVAAEHHVEAEPGQGVPHRGGVVDGVPKPARVLVGAVADDKGHPVGGRHRRRRAVAERRQRDDQRRPAPPLSAPGRLPAAGSDASFRRFLRSRRVCVSFAPPRARSTAVSSRVCFAERKDDGRAESAGNAGSHGPRPTLLHRRAVPVKVRGRAQPFWIPPILDETGHSIGNDSVVTRRIWRHRKDVTLAAASKRNDGHSRGLSGRAVTARLRTSAWTSAWRTRTNCRTRIVSSAVGGSVTRPASGQSSSICVVGSSPADSVEGVGRS